MVTVYVPIGIQFVAKIPELLVVPLTVVAITPPLMVTVAPRSAAPDEFTALTLILPAVASGKFKVAVPPLGTLTVRLRGR
jgi:hypothetical protein